jgi:hypothetical protein
VRRAARVDDNHPAIVRALRATGCMVQSLAMVGDGCPDLLVMRAGTIKLLEVKDGSKVPSARKLTPQESRWHQQAHLHGVPVYVVESIDDALALF